MHWISFCLFYFEDNGRKTKDKKDKYFHIVKKEIISSTSVHSLCSHLAL